MAQCIHRRDLIVLFVSGALTFVPRGVAAVLIIIDTTTKTKLEPSRNYTEKCAQKIFKISLLVDKNK